jgi:hypothetical protein
MTFGENGGQEMDEEYILTQLEVTYGGLGTLWFE